MEPESVNLVGAANRIGVTVGTIKYWILKGTLPATKVGRRWVIDISTLDRVNELQITSDSAKYGRRGKRGKFVT